MTRTLTLFACLGLAACSKSTDKERWQAPPADDKAAPAPTQSPPTPAAPAAAVEVRHIVLSVTDDGFEPTPVAVKANQPVMLMITRKTDKTCAKEIVVPDYKIEKTLPLNQMVEVSFTPTKTGELVYGCAMGQMVKGVLTVQ